MSFDSFDFDTTEEFIAAVTDIAYQALLRQGLRESFLDVQLRLWNEIREAYHEHRAAEPVLAEVA
jgi:hypothetical protein